MTGGQVAVDPLARQFEATYKVGGAEVVFRYGEVFHAPGALYGAVMVPSRVGPKFQGCYRRSVRSDRWRRLGGQFNDPVRALKVGRSRADRKGNG